MLLVELALIRLIGLLGLLVLGTSIWVLVDAKTIGVRKGLVKGFFDIGPWGWFFSCLLIWIIAFPIYIAKRGEFKRLNAERFMQNLYQYQSQYRTISEKTYSDPDTKKRTTIDWIESIGLVVLLFVIFRFIVISFVDNYQNKTPPPPVAQYNNSPTLNPNEDLKLSKGWGWTADNYGNEYIEGTVVNRSDNTYSSVFIRFNLYDEENNLVGNANDIVDNLRPHETWKFKALVPYDNAYSAEFAGIDGY
ncbi:FxLYD domain-containing protein [Mesoaciditoga lauensis]|uniref:FxLYD domain-containing protein n=1 Tax=Mesoaciditoga lauensis TaxID=1495039 RepID=UPI00056BBDD4|nr:FxLYD domain-containing protein [Mesoaciditoga lauensis]